MSLTPVGAAVAVAGGGAAVVLLVGYPLGELAGALESSIDVPTFEWMQSIQTPQGVAINEVTTQMGNRPQTKAIALIGSVVLAIVFRHRGWWIPPLAIWGAYGMEKYLQEALAVLVDRGHPPTTLGTFPSGGVARIVVVWGMIVFLVGLAYPLLDRRIQTLMILTVAVATAIESLSRTYLLQHWWTDVAASWVFGPMVLLAAIGAVQCLLLTRWSPIPMVPQKWWPPGRDRSASTSTTSAPPAR